MAASRRTTAGVLGCIGCSVVGCAVAYYVLVGGIIVVGLGVGINQAAACVPSDFPHYAPSVWGGTSGGGSQCADTQLSFGSAADIYSFYRAELTRPGSNWVAISADPNARAISFKHATGQPTVGIFWIVERFGYNAYCRLFNKNPSRSADLSSLMAFRSAPSGYHANPICEAPTNPVQV